MLEVKGYMDDVPQSQLVETGPGSRLRFRKKLGDSAPPIHFKTIGFVSF